MTLESAYEYVTQGSLAKKLYKYMSHEYTKDVVMSDLEHDYLTINGGFDGRTYIWYAGGVTDVAICVEDGRIIDGTEGVLWWE